LHTPCKPRHLEVTTEALIARTACEENAALKIKSGHPVKDVRMYATSRVSCRRGKPLMRLESYMVR